MALAATHEADGSHTCLLRCTADYFRTLSTYLHWAVLRTRGGRLLLAELTRRIMSLFFFLIKLEAWQAKQLQYLTKSQAWETQLRVFKLSLF